MISSVDCVRDVSTNDYSSLANWSALIIKQRQKKTTVQLAKETAALKKEDEKFKDFFPTLIPAPGPSSAQTVQQHFDSLHRSACQCMTSLQTYQRGFLI